MMQSAPVNWRGVSQSTRASSTGKTRSSSTTSRSKAKAQRNTKKPSLSAFERGVAKARTFVDNSTPEHLETRLQKLLIGSKYSEAAFLIVASSHLSGRFQTADVARLMLEQAKSPQALEQAAQLVRDLQLQQNNALVTLLINEMVRALQFSAAVRLAQEMVPGFEQLSASAATVKRPCWTPPALIQAMLRARKYRAALKYSKQFGLLETFPAPQLVAGMLETRCWEEAVSSVMEIQLFKEFPLEALAVEMMKQRQWSQAIKCMNKMSDKDDTRMKFYEALVRETAHVGDFVTSVRCLREFKLDQGNGDATVNLLRYLVDAMLAHGEFYKAIKYAIKFKLAKNLLDDAIAAAANGEEVPRLSDDVTEYLPQYNVETLIRRAIDGGQFHVATTYIKRLRLREEFVDELVAIEKAQQNRLLEFRQYAQLRLAQFQDPALQQNLRDLLGDQADDEMVELEPVEMEIVLLVEEEIFPCDKKTLQAEKEEEEKKEEKDNGSKRNEERCQAPVFESNTTDETHQRESNAPAETSDESRFGFARAPLPPPQPPLPSDPLSVVGVSGVDGDNQPRIKPLSPVKAAPPGLFDSSERESVEGQKQDDAGSFNFANFAQSFQGSDPPPPPNPTSTPLPLQRLPPPQQQQPLLSQQEQVQAIFGQPMRNGQFASGPPAYPMPPMMPQQNAMYFPRGNMPAVAMQPRGYLQPPPPPPPPPSNNGGGAFDVAALAMQFHNGGGSNGSSGFSGFGGPRPLMGYPGALPNGQQQQLFPGMSPPPFSAPPPQSAFKPSMSYTSVTTTRQKK